MTTIDGKAYLSKTSDALIKIAAIIGAITVIGGAYTYYLNNIWKPNVTVDSVDFDKGIARVRVGNKILDIYGDATFLINNYGDWGIRFGTSRITNKYDRLELVKKMMVAEYLKKNQ
jgi:hypothetical protein